jgi:hypothetical protein
MPLGMARRLSVFAHKQRTNQWFETAPKLATISGIDVCEAAAQLAANFALTCPVAFCRTIVRYLRHSKK